MLILSERLDGRKVVMFMRVVGITLRLLYIAW